MVGGVRGELLQANNGARCTTNADCTWGGVCKPPVDALGSVYVLVGGPGGGGCNPLCNGLASFTATVDFSASTSAGDAYTLMRGCYDEQHAAGMRRLGGTGAGAGQRPVTLAWKSLIPDGEIIGRPGLAADGSVIVASARGTLNKVTAPFTAAALHPPRHRCIDRIGISCGCRGKNHRERHHNAIA